MNVKKVIKKMKSKKGAAMVEFTIVLTLFVTIFCMGFDFIMFGYKYMSVSNYANDLVRVMSVQGGAASSVPRGFQGGSNSYKTLAKIRSEKNVFAKTVGAKSDEVNIFVVYDGNAGQRQELNIDTITGFTVDYLVPFEIVIEYIPKLELLGNFGFSLKNRVRIVKVGVSEYIQNY